MKKFLLFICIMTVLFCVSCVVTCPHVTGPNDITYHTLGVPECYPQFAAACDSGVLINSASDFDILCPGGTAPASWNFAGRTYIVICAGNTAKEPYLAGIGNDPADTNQVIVTIGKPCSFSIVPAMYVYKTFVLEIPKTTKTLKVDIKDEL